MSYINNILLGLKALPGYVSWRGGRCVLLGMLYLLSFSLQAQEEIKELLPPKYYIEGDQVIFEFDIRSYEEGIKDKGSIFQDFKEVDLPKLVEEGVLVDWSYEGWTFHQKGKYVYQFTKKLDQFSDEFSPQLKFLIDGRYWTQPFSQALENTEGVIEPGFRVTENGNVTFKLKTDKKARNVILTGTFNHWDEKELEMKKRAEGWELTLQLSPGIYEYKFIVDSEWITDPNNPNKVPNNYETFNSILLVGKKVDFFFPGFTQAKQVILAGSFNNWDEHAISCERDQDGWLCSVELPPGKHFYKFIVDGNWILDPTNNLAQKDKEGHLNSVLIVR